MGKKNREEQGRKDDEAAGQSEPAADTQGATAEGAEAPAVSAEGAQGDSDTQGDREQAEAAGEAGEQHDPPAGTSTGEKCFVCQAGIMEEDEDRVINTLSDPHGVVLFSVHLCGKDAVAPKEWHDHVKEGRQ